MKNNRYFVLLGAVGIIGVSLLSYVTMGNELPLLAGKTSYSLTLSGSSNKIMNGDENNSAGICLQTDLGNDFYIYTYFAATAAGDNFITLPPAQFMTNFYSAAPSTNDVGSIHNLLSVSVTCSENFGDGMYMYLYSDWGDKTLFYSTTIIDTQTHVYTDFEFGSQAPENIWFMFGLPGYFSPYSVTIESIVFTYGC